MRLFLETMRKERELSELKIRIGVIWRRYVNPIRWYSISDSFSNWIRTEEENEGQ